MRKGLFYLELKEKLDKKYVYFIYMFLLIFLAGFHVSRFQKGDYMQSFQGGMISGIFSFVCLMFLAYEVFADLQAKDWRELLCLKATSLHRVISSKSLLLLLFSIGNFAVVLVTDLVQLQQVELGSLLQPIVLRSIVLNYLCVPLVGIAFGKACALVAKKRWSGYLWMLGLTVLVCGLFEKINMALYMTVGVNLDKVFALFQLKQPNVDWVVDGIYFVPVEQYRFLICAAWILGCEAVISLVFFRKKAIRFLVAAVCTVFCVLTVVHVVKSDNYVNFNMNNGAAGKQVEFEKDEEQAEVAADFTVKTCSIDMKITDELQADAVLVLEDNEQTEYRFTLYRGYALTRVTDAAGVAVPYERSNDYITIRSEQPLTEIHLQYHGFSKTFYSNEQGIFLPGYFAYYPQAGHRQVFWDELVDQMVYYGYNVRENTLTETEYVFSIAYNGRICSNLSYENGFYEGRSLTPTIVGGLVAEMQSGECQLIYPAAYEVSAEAVEKVRQYLVDYSKQLNLDSTPYENIRHVILVPTGIYIDNEWGIDIRVGDCLYLQEAQMDESLALTSAEILRHELDVRGKKSQVAVCMFDVLMGAKYIYGVEALDEETFFSISYDEDDQESEAYLEVMYNGLLERMYITLLENFEATEVFEGTISYVLDDSNTMSCGEFMQALYRELEDR